MDEELAALLATLPTDEELAALAATLPTDEELAALLATMEQMTQASNAAMGYRATKVG